MIALDATYSVGRNLSGVGVYSRELLYGLAGSFPEEHWAWYFRSNRYFRSPELPQNVRKRMLWEVWGSRRAELFHGLNQRLPKRRFRRQVVTFHDLFVLSAEYSSADFRERFAEQARHAAAEADVVIAVSQFTANQVTEFLGVPQSRIRVVWHGVVSHGITPRQLPEGAREKIILCTGAIQRRKNQVTLVRAFRAMPENWRLVLAGSQGYEAQETLDAVAASPARDRIHITGYIADDELARWYSRAGIFAFPSLDEGFGMPVLEAMAAGVPVIAGNRSALPEVCGNAAILVDPADEEQLITAMSSLAEDPALCAEYVRRGHKRAEVFSWKRAVQETASIYRAVI